MGRIAAGTPISAIQTPSHTIAMSADFLASGEALRPWEVRGDSMVDAGILDNDTVIIRRQDTANTGDIVVALVDDEDATLKRLRRRGASIALEPANAAYENAHLRAGARQGSGHPGEPACAGIEAGGPHPPGRVSANARPPRAREAALGRTSCTSAPASAPSSPRRAADGR